MIKDIIIGIGLLFCIPSCVYFWKWIIEYEEQGTIYEREIMFDDKEDN